MTVGELTAGAKTRSDHRRLAAGTMAILFAALLLVALSNLGAPSRMTMMAAFGVLGLGLLTKPRAATLLFIAVLYLNLPVVAMRYHGVDPLIASLAPLLLAIPLLSYVIIQRQAVVVTRALFWILAYLTVMIISAMFSTSIENTARAVGHWTTEGLVLYLLVTNAVRTVDILKKSVVVLLAAGAFMGALSLYQEVTETYTNEYWGFAQTGEEGEEGAVVDGRPRLSGPIGSKNRYAQIMLVLLPLAGYAFVTTRNRLHRSLAAASGILILAGMLFTFSRGAGVALIALVLVAILLRSIRPRSAIIGTAVLVLAIFTVAPDFYHRMESLAGVGSLVSEESGERPDGAILGRATSNLASLYVFFDHPIIGVGPGRYPAEYSVRYANELGLRHFTGQRRAHNLYFEIAAELGIFGITAFLGIIGATLAGLWRERRRWLNVKPEYGHLATALMLSVMGYMLSAVFLHMAYMRYFWVLIALANSAIWILHRATADSDEKATA
jgi:putative inorganic carbon (hco3(-)) transporter